MQNKWINMLNAYHFSGALFLCLALAGCGGGGGAPSTAMPSADVATITPASGTGNIYDPVKPGTQIQFAITAITATLGAGNQISIQSIGAQQSPETWQYSSTTCGATFYFVETEQAGLISALAAVPPNRSSSLWDMNAISADGIAYTGEGANIDGFVNPPEPEITASPVVGEIINTYSVVTSPTCGDTTVLNPAFHSQYTTIEHLAKWNGFADVWHTRLIEFNADGSIGAVYEYYFANGIGQVGINYVDSIDTSTNVWSGYQAIAISEGSVQ